MKALLWALLALLLTPALPAAVIAALTTSTPVVTRRVAAVVAVAGLAAEVGNPILRDGIARIVDLGPVLAVLAAAACLVLVVAVVGVVWYDRRHEAFLAEWAAYVTAENEGRQAPAAPPRFAQVARSLAHNRRADALREHPGVIPGAWRDAGSVRLNGPLAVTAVVSLAAAVSNAAVGRWSVVVPAGLATLLSGGLAAADALHDRQGARRAAANAPSASTSPAAGLCESCQLAPATARVMFPDGALFAVCHGCAPARPHRSPRSGPALRSVAVALRRVGGDPR